MARLLSMPKLSDTMEEGAIATWLKKKGDKISEGDPLAEIETDKATMEYEAPENGFILKMLVDVGGRAKVGAPIAIVGDTKDESFDESKLVSASGGGAKDSKPASSSSTMQSASSLAAPQVSPAGAPSLSTLQVGSQSAPALSTSQVSVSNAGAAGGRLRASPLAKKIAQEKGVNLQNVPGSGPGGRIVAKDLEALQLPGGRAPTMMPTGGADQSVRVSMMRQTIAKRLLAAKNDAPHFYLTRSIDMTAVNRWRERTNEKLKSHGVKVSVNDIIIFAVARALKAHPMVNASWQGEQIVQFGSVHVAMAVALPEGLVTPVIRHADQRGLQDIAVMTKEYAAKARNGQLKNEDFAGGTFTVSNLGMMGIEEFTAIINPPQAAILAVGATIKLPVVDDHDNVVVKPMMKVTMSCDHRVVDGMVGAAFLKTLTAYLEDPLEMFG